MNVLRLSLAALAVAAVNANAQDPAAVTVDCASMRSPHTADVARLVGTQYDLWATFDARQRVIALAKPACERGANTVQFVAGVDRVTGQLALAAADAN
jgi:hypothetical protein